MGWMFKKITPDFINKANMAGIDAGKERVVWVGVKNRIQKKIDSAWHEAVGKKVVKSAEKISNLMSSETIAKQIRELERAGIITKIVIDYTALDHNLAWNIFNFLGSGEENYGSITVKVTVDNEMNAEYDVTFKKPEGMAGPGRWKTKNFDELKTAIQERILWVPVENERKAFGHISSIPAYALRDVWSGIMESDLKGIEKLEVNRWMLIRKDGQLMLVGKSIVKDSGDRERLSSYYVNCGFLKGRTGTVKDDLNKSGFSTLNEDGYSYLFKPGMCYEEEGSFVDPGTTRLLTLRSRMKVE